MKMSGASLRRAAFSFLSGAMGVFANGQADPGFFATLLPSPARPPDRPPSSALLRCPASPFYRYSLQRSGSLEPDSWRTVLPRLYSDGRSLAVQIALPTGGAGVPATGDTASLPTYTFTIDRQLSGTPGWLVTWTGAAQALVSQWIAPPPASAAALLPPFSSHKVLPDANHPPGGGVAIPADGYWLQLIFTDKPRQPGMEALMAPPADQPTLRWLTNESALWRLNADATQGGFPAGASALVSAPAAQGVFYRFQREVDADSDGDGLTDAEEFFRHLDPFNVDSDGDGLWDGTTFAASDPEHTAPWAQRPPEIAAAGATDPNDPDGDGVPNESDADPYQYLIAWPRSPEPSCLFVPLPDVPHVTGLQAVAVDDLGRVLLTAHRTVTAMTLPFGSIAPVPGDWSVSDYGVWRPGQPIHWLIDNGPLAGWFAQALHPSLTLSDLVAQEDGSTLAVGKIEASRIVHYTFTPPQPDLPDSNDVPIAFSEGLVWKIPPTFGPGTISHIQGQNAAAGPLWEPSVLPQGLVSRLGTITSADRAGHLYGQITRTSFANPGLNDIYGDTGKRAHFFTATTVPLRWPFPPETPTFTALGGDTSLWWGSRGSPAQQIATSREMKGHSPGGGIAVDYREPYGDPPTVVWLSQNGDPATEEPVPTAGPVRLNDMPDQLASLPPNTPRPATGYTTGRVVSSWQTYVKAYPKTPNSTVPPRYVPIPLATSPPDASGHRNRVYTSPIGFNDRGEFALYDALWRNASLASLDDLIVPPEGTVAFSSSIRPTSLRPINNSGALLVQTYLAPLLPNGAVDYELTTAVEGVLLPIELRDVKGPGPGDDVMIQTASARIDSPREPQIAFIEPHGGTAGSPMMPQLEAAVPGGPANLDVEWTLEVRYDRGNGYLPDRNLSQDIVRIPQSGFPVTKKANEVWKIYEDTGWKNELASAGFFGGHAVLKMQIGNTEQRIHFLIGGKNPQNDLAREALRSRQPDVWYAYAICKHETEEYRYGGTYYNQFVGNPKGKKIVYSKYGRTFQFGYGAPAWNWDFSDQKPGGYGLFQVTGWQGQSNGNVPRDVIWNWQRNIDEGASEIRRDKVPDATAYFNAVKGKYGANTPSPPNVSTGKPHDPIINGFEASVIVRYNGTRDLPIHPELSPPLQYTRDPWTYSNGRWIGPAPNSQNYLNKVLAEFE